jgi:N utilization substance protein A
VILQKIRDAEREQIQRLSVRKEPLVTGAKRMERGNAIVESGRLEAVLPRDQMIRRRICAWATGCGPTWKTDRASRGPQFVLSRTAPEFLVKLFELRCPNSRTVCSRSRRRRTRLACKNRRALKDRRIDPIGTCVGMRVRECRRDFGVAGSVDIILWAEDPAQFVVNALAPSRVSKIKVDEEAHSMDIVVDEENPPGMIGRTQNVRLASELTGWELNHDAGRVEEERGGSDARQNHVHREADVDEEVAAILVEEGLTPRGGRLRPDQRDRRSNLSTSHHQRAVEPRLQRAAHAGDRERGA